jgi:hypothetical protein
MDLPGVCLILWDALFAGSSADNVHFHASCVKLSLSYGALHLVGRSAGRQNNPTFDISAFALRIRATPRWRSSPQRILKKSLTQTGLTRVSTPALGFRLRGQV